MAWQIATVVLSISTLVLGIITIWLMVQAANKRQPIWASRTMHLIGLEPDIPEQVKIVFDDKPVSIVFRTEFIFFNRGRMVIQEADVARKITVYFAGATILAEPSWRSNRPEIEFKPRRLLKDGEHVVELDFRYLAHNDGAVVEVLHTEIESDNGLPRPSGSFVAGEEIVSLKEFDPFRFRDWIDKYKKPGNFIPIGALTVFLGFIASLAVTRDDLSYLSLPLSFLGLLIIVTLQRYRRSQRFPKWATNVEERSTDS